MARRGQPIAERWKQHLEAALSSGQSIAAYAREHGLNRKNLFWASGRLGHQSRVALEEVQSSSPSKITQRTNERHAFVPVRTQERAEEAS